MLLEEIRTDADHTSRPPPIHEVQGGHAMADKSLNRTELVAAIAADSGQSQAGVNSVVDALFAVVSKNVADGVKVSIPGWVAFEKSHRGARTGRNPQTGEALEIAASDGVKVTAGSKLKAAVK
jgi:DNA-binding protein HU-beta